MLWRAAHTARADLPEASRLRFANCVAINTGLPPLSAIRQREQPQLHDSRPSFRAASGTHSANFPAGLFFDGDDYLRLPRPEGWQPRRQGFTVVALIEPVGSGWTATAMSAASPPPQSPPLAAREGEVVNQQKGLNRGNKKPKRSEPRHQQQKLPRRPRATRCFWIGIGNPGVGDVQWALSTASVAQSHDGTTAAAKQQV
eukprot:SAG31_NODE_306_length_17979_cov_7.825447_7_plen_200_part_00